MSKIRHLTYSPMQMAEDVPWDRVRNAVLVVEMRDENGLEGDSLVYSSEMVWKDRIWLSELLRVHNVADRITIEEC